MVCYSSFFALKNNNLLCAFRILLIRVIAFPAHPHAVSADKILAASQAGARSLRNRMRRSVLPANSVDGAAHGIKPHL
jgi:hypothetical protein